MIIRFLNWIIYCLFLKGSDLDRGTNNPQHIIFWNRDLDSLVINHSDEEKKKIEGRVK